MTAAEDGVGIGARLRAARERRGLTVLQAAEKLHVDARVLEALEADNFAPLGADVYVRGHLRRYAELVGESPAELQTLYVNASPAVQPDLTRIPRGERPPGSARLVLPAVLGVVALALAGAVWWALTLPRLKPNTLTPAPPVTSAVGATADDTAGEAAAPTPAVHAPATPGVPGSAELTLKFSGVSWVQIADAHGKVLLDGLQSPGGTRSVSGLPPLRVVLGNAAAVALEVNGRPASLAGLTRHGGDAHLRVDAGGTLAAVGSQPGQGED